MCREGAASLHSSGPPWWLLDMRPQGFLGRAYAARHGAELGLPGRLTEWTDTHALRALLMHGHDVVGNLLLGEILGSSAGGEQPKFTTCAMALMSFAPRSSGGLPDTLREATIHASVPNEIWRHAEELVRTILSRVMADTGFSHRFVPCIAALECHIKAASARIGRLG